jgi:hypothetical protein
VGDFNMITRAEDKNRPAWEDQYAKEWLADSGEP